MKVANTVAGRTWTSLLASNDLSSISQSSMPNLVSAIDQLSRIDEHEPVFVSENGAPIQYAGELVKSLTRLSQHYRNIIKAQDGLAHHG